MHKKICLSVFALSLLILLVSCSDPEAVKAETEKKEQVKKDSVARESAEIKNMLRTYKQFSDTPGVAGIYEVHEMLTICRKDSASADKMAEAFARNYSLLEADLRELKVRSEGAPGSIYYNDDQNNLVFECVFPILDIPQKNPKHSQIVSLEASPMLIYNHYGPYYNLQDSYRIIRKYLSENFLVQSGPMREFYINNPTKVRDTSKWLTRIMIPVAKKKAN